MLRVDCCVLLVFGCLCFVRGSVVRVVCCCCRFLDCCLLLVWFVYNVPLFVVQLLLSVGGCGLLVGCCLLFVVFLWC